MRTKAGWLGIVLWGLVIVYGAYVMMLMLPIVKHEYYQWYVNKLDAASYNELSSKMLFHYLKGQNGLISGEEYEVKNRGTIDVQAGDQLFFCLRLRDADWAGAMKLHVTELQRVRGAAQMAYEPKPLVEGLENMSFLEARGGVGRVIQYFYIKDRWGFPVAVLVINFNITNVPKAPTTEPNEADRSV